MTVELVILVFFLSPLLAYGGVTAGVAGTTWYAVRRGRRDPQDAFQERVFLAQRVSLPHRAAGLAAEGFWQTVAFGLQGVHLLRKFRNPPLLSQAGDPVILVAGYLENGGQMQVLARRLRRRGYQPVVIDLPSTLRSIRDNAAFLRQVIERVLAESGAQRVALVGHSMGGVIGRACVHMHEDLPVAAVVSICSPHRGTHLARLGPGRSAADMRPGSEHMRAHPPWRRGSVPIHTVISLQDNIVSPAWSTVLCEGDNTLLKHPVGHVAPLFLRSVEEQVAEWLDQAALERRGPGCMNRTAPVSGLPSQGVSVNSTSSHS